MKVEELHDHWLLTPPETHITRLLIDAAFTIQLSGVNGDADIRIEVPFTVESAGGNFQCDATHPETLLPVLGIFLKELSHIKVYRSGVLDLMIDDHLHVIASPDEQYESWSITGSSWYGVTCMPGGSVAFWMPPNAHQST